MALSAFADKSQKPEAAKLLTTLGRSGARWSELIAHIEAEYAFRTVDSPAVRRLSLSGFDMSCEAPMLMLDVNAELEDDAKVLIRKFESFECAN